MRLDHPGGAGGGVCLLTRHFKIMHLSLERRSAAKLATPAICSALSSRLKWTSMNSTERLLMAYTAAMHVVGVATHRLVPPAALMATMDSSFFTTGDPLLGPLQMEPVWRPQSPTAPCTRGIREQQHRGGRRGQQARPVPLASKALPPSYMYILG